MSIILFSFDNTTFSIINIIIIIIITTTTISTSIIIIFIQLCVHDNINNNVDDDGVKFYPLSTNHICVIWFVEHWTSKSCKFSQSSNIHHHIYMYNDALIVIYEWIKKASNLIIYIIIIIIIIMMYNHWNAILYFIIMI